MIELKAKNANLEVLTIGRHSFLSHCLLRASLGGGTRAKVFAVISAGEMSHHREDYSLEGTKSELILRGMPIAIGRAVDYLTNVLQYGERSKSETRVHGFSYNNG